MGAAVNTRETSKKTVELLVEAGADILVIDSSNGSSSYQINLLKFIKETYPQVDVVAGNGNRFFFIFRKNILTLPLSKFELESFI